MRSALSIDPFIFFPVLLLSVIGILGIYSTGFNAELTFYQGMYIKQILWLCIGLVLFIITLIIPLRVHEVFAYFYYIIAIGLLIGVLVFGSTGGARSMRWFDLGFFNLQPSEFAKIALVFALARFLSHYRRKFPNAISIATVIFLGMIPFGLVVKQPDLGTALVFAIITLFMLYWAGLSLFHLFLFVSPL
ncbi:MAG: hypothetical protein GF315_09560, partial [candidate division Zixibacteria bacterium]|nr:hypothetical protein [candidate division Zixibacteria bacterium]